METKIDLPIYKYQLLDIGEYNVHVLFERYQTNSRPAIQLIDADTGECFMTASVNLPCCGIESDEVCIKNYSENEGVLEFLQNNGFVGPTIRKVPTGMVEAHVAKILNNH